MADTRMTFCNHLKTFLFTRELKLIRYVVVCWVAAESAGWRRSSASIKRPNWCLTHDDYCTGSSRSVAVIVYWS